MLRPQIQAYLLAKRAENLRDNTIIHYECCLRQFADWLESRGVARLDQLTPEAARGYIRHRLRTERDSSVREYAVVVKQWAKWLCSQGLLLPDLPAAIKLPRVDHHDRDCPSGDECALLLAAVARRWRNATQLATILSGADA